MFHISDVPFDDFSVQPIRKVRDETKTIDKTKTTNCKDGDGAERDGPTPYRYVPRETENQVGRARG